MSIFLNIRKLRIQRGIKQSILVYNLGISQSQYTRIENGTRDVTLTFLEKLCTEFGISLEDFYLEEEKLIVKSKVEENKYIPQNRAIDENDYLKKMLEEKEKQILKNEKELKEDIKELNQEMKSQNERLLEVEKKLYAIKP